MFPTHPAKGLIYLRSGVGQVLPLEFLGLGPIAKGESAVSPPQWKFEKNFRANHTDQGGWSPFPRGFGSGAEKLCGEGRRMG